MFLKNKLVIVTDAWYPQVNGVVTMYSNLIDNLPEDWEVTIIEPSMFKTFKFGLYKNIEMALVPKEKLLDVFWDSVGNHYIFKVHIATEGPLGLQMKRLLDQYGMRYTTAYHTKFPEYIQSIYKIPAILTRWYFNWFHKKSKLVLVPSKSVAKENPKWNTRVWDSGHSNFFEFKEKQVSRRPILLYVGRVSKEKNIEDFCEIGVDSWKYTKIVVGDGPDRKRLQNQYDDVHFVGYKFGEELVSYYQNADVFVFPSKTDTFGIVMLEAMACGTPVAAYPATGPIDLITNNDNGYVDDNLTVAVNKCLGIERKTVYNSVIGKTWQRSAKQFIKYIGE